MPKGKSASANDERPPIIDFTAAAESAKLREWGKSKGAKKDNGSHSEGKEPWHSTKYNSDKQTRNPTKVVPAHPEKVRHRSSDEPKEWQHDLRDGAADPQALAEPWVEDDSGEQHQRVRDRLWHQFQVEHEREVHELQRCLEVQSQEIADLHIKSLQLVAAKDIAKSLYGDLERSNKSYTLMEKKWLDATEALRAEQHRNAELTVQLENAGSAPAPSAAPHLAQDDQELPPSSIYSLHDAQDAFEEQHELTTSELAASAKDAHLLVAELHHKGKHADADEAHELARKLDEVVAQRRESNKKYGGEDASGDKEDTYTQTIIQLKEAETRLQERERELEAERLQLSEARTELTDATEKIHELPSNEDYAKLTRENNKQKMEIEQLQMKLADNTLVMAEEYEGCDEAELLQRIAELQKDKEQDHQELMLEMKGLEQEKNQQIQELEAKIEQLKA